jgi:hypothetical protein
MTSSSLLKLFDYWNEVRAGRIAPRRLEIEPAAIAPILAETFMLERSDQETYPYRLAGTRCCEIFGLELRGSDFLGGWSVADRTTLTQHLRSVCEQGAALRIASVASSDVRHALEIEMMLLPLVHTGETLSRVIGAVSLRSEPHWLGHERLSQRKLIHCDLIWPDGRPHSLVARTAEKQPFVRDFGPVEVVRSDRRTFRVLQGGRGSGEPSKG